MKLSPRQIENAVFSLVRERGPMDRFAVHASLPHIRPDAIDLALKNCELSRLLAHSGGTYSYPLDTAGQIFVRVHTCSARAPDDSDEEEVAVPLRDPETVIRDALRTRSPLELAWGGLLA